MTPLRDGMNLVAKEYVASQDPPTIPVCWCCRALPARHASSSEAVLVNPIDIDGMAEAIMHGLDMPLGERKERWTAMMTVSAATDIGAWRREFRAGACRGGRGALSIGRGQSTAATGSLATSAPPTPVSRLVDGAGQITRTRVLACDDYATIEDALAAYLGKERRRSGRCKKRRSPLPRR